MMVFQRTSLILSAGKLVAGLKLVVQLGLIFIFPNTLSLACTCSPLVYRFRIDMSRTCSPLGMEHGTGSGVSQEGICDLENRNGGSDKTPVKIEKVILIELDEEFDVIKQEKYFDLKDGDMIIFTSDVISTPSNVPDSFLVTTQAINNSSEKIALDWFVDFSHQCDIHPFQAADSIGWFVLESLDPATPGMCNFQSSLPSYIPTVSFPPSDIRSFLPSNVPSNGESLFLFNLIMYPVETVFLPADFSILTQLTISTELSDFPSNDPSELNSHSPTKKVSNSPSQEPITKASISPSKVFSVLPSIFTTNRLVNDSSIGKLNVLLF